MMGAYFIAAIVITALSFGIPALPPRTGMWALVTLAAAMSCYWMVNGNTLNFTWFVFAKFYSVFFGAIFFQWLKTTQWKPMYGKVVFLILTVNILEASITDIARYSAINGLAGLLLILSQPSAQTVKIESGKARHLLYETSWFWIFGYTLWNFTFVYGQVRVNSVPLAVLHLGIPLLLCIFNTALYLQYRSYAISFAMLFWVFPPVRSHLNWPGTFFNAEAANILACLSLALAMALLLVRLHRVRTDK